MSPPVVPSVSPAVSVALAAVGSTVVVGVVSDDPPVAPLLPSLSEVVVDSGVTHAPVSSEPPRKSTKEGCSTCVGIVPWARSVCSSGFMVVSVPTIGL